MGYIGERASVMELRELGSWAPLIGWGRVGRQLITAAGPDVTHGLLSGLRGRCGQRGHSTFRTYV